MAEARVVKFYTQVGLGLDLGLEEAGLRGPSCPDISK